MGPLELVRLSAIMERTSGSPHVRIGFIDGPVLTHHPDLTGDHFRELPGQNGGSLYAGHERRLSTQHVYRRGLVNGVWHDY